MLNALWQGEAKLWKVFWGGLLLPFITMFLLGFLSGVLNLHLSFSFTKSLGYIVLVTAYYFLWSIVTWKCARNTSGVFWTYLARFMVIIIFLIILGVLVRSVNPPPLTAYSPACIKTLEDFAIKNGFETQKYIENNKPYLQKCTDTVYKNSCTRMMRDFAVKTGLDPEQYTSRHWFYLVQCTQYLKNKDNGVADSNLAPPPPQ
jgi:hypothetical protein